MYQSLHASLALDADAFRTLNLLHVFSGYHRLDHFRFLFPLSFSFMDTFYALSNANWLVDSSVEFFILNAF